MVVHLLPLAPLEHEHGGRRASEAVGCGFFGRWRGRILVTVVIVVVLLLLLPVPIRLVLQIVVLPVAIVAAIPLVLLPVFIVVAIRTIALPVLESGLYTRQVFVPPVYVYNCICTVVT
jgi:hypothetical protein